MMDLQYYYIGDGELRDAAEFSIRKYTRYENLHVDYAYSCLGEQDLNGKHYLAKHWGENYEIMNGIVTTDCCKKVLRHAKQDVNAARAKRTPEINMVLMCRSGRHRSIAISRILRACLDHAECKNGKNVNLSEGYWEGLCTTCDSCNNGAERRRKWAIDYAITFWEGCDHMTMS